jgi:hypothetical protein
MQIEKNLMFIDTYNYTVKTAGATSCTGQGVRGEK